VPDEPLVPLVPDDPDDPDDPLVPDVPEVVPVIVIETVWSPTLSVTITFGCPDLIFLNSKFTPDFW